MAVSIILTRVEQLADECYLLGSSGSKVQQIPGCGWMLCEQNFSFEIPVLAKYRMYKPLRTEFKSHLHGLSQIKFLIKIKSIQFFQTKIESETKFKYKIR